MADRPHDAHGNHADEEDALRTPLWLPLLGIGLLLLGALGSYLWIYPGTLNPTVIADGGDAGDAATEAGAPANAPQPGQAHVLAPSGQPQIRQIAAPPSQGH